MISRYWYTTLTTHSLEKRTISSYPCKLWLWRVDANQEGILWHRMNWKSKHRVGGDWIQRFKSRNARERLELLSLHRIPTYTWDIKPFAPWTKSDFLKHKKFKYVPDFARCKKLRTKTDFDLVFVEGSKLGTKTDYNCRKKSRNFFEYVVME